jgi:hypothetical protein
MVTADHWGEITAVIPSTRRRRRLTFVADGYFFLRSGQTSPEPNHDRPPVPRHPKCRYRASDPAEAARTMAGSFVFQRTKKPA